MAPYQCSKLLVGKSPRTSATAFRTSCSSSYSSIAPFPTAYPDSPPRTAANSVQRPARATVGRNQSRTKDIVVQKDKFSCWMHANVVSIDLLLGY
ncbi:hypothetical protein JB92DRAFT_2893098 [Gautieria morchelliformis]|nr:hypothetical protein JB92DRAFT_2893098 [Gautieria morchelliformis]